MEFVGLTVRADMLAGSLNVAQKKRLEMARALAARPYLLLLDEVLAGLNVTEVSHMLDTIRAIRDHGMDATMTTGGSSVTMRWVRRSWSSGDEVSRYFTSRRPTICTR